MKQATELQRLLTTKEAAEFLGVKPNTLEVWRSTQRYDIPHIKVGASVRYRPLDLVDWIDSQRQGGSLEN